MSNTVSITPNASFTKEHRLLTPAAFREVFDAPERKLHQSHLMAFVRAINMTSHELVWRLPSVKYLLLSLEI